ncbi:GIY-YIG nuclease family protein [Agromyces endophyticus]|uniref:GIY-YIG nuclease family protein n=1 Tax=Agromyces sp. H17E-10 TaxID=2932244 RepID=UPI001FD55373|nr:GIY-YIG nuclease family protein [Agromyces sp. H17E-10]UOQ90927.1 GIY-YIG nuclease family protein [Agromyces sp. H17E-10]
MVAKRFGGSRAAAGAVETDAPTAPCSIVEADGARCSNSVAAGAPIALCAGHLLVAYDWIAREAGELDLLPSPCPACGARVGVHYPSGWICADCEWRYGEVPDRPVDDDPVEVVYYLRYRDQVKIGTSANPRQRVASLPHDEVLAFERGGRRLERRRHEQFAAYRGAGTEWFDVHDALLEHIAELAAGVDDPWLQYDRWVSRHLARPRL